MKQDISQWLKSKEEEADRVLTRLEAVTLDDSFGWGDRLKRFDPQNGAEYYCPGVLLTGPAGCGKHNAANFLIKRFSNKGCRFCFLFGDALDEEYESYAELEKNLNALLDARYEAYEAGRNGDTGALCLVLDEPESYSCAKQLYRFVGQNISEYYLGGNTYPDFFAIVISQETPAMDALLRENLMLCRLGYPDLARRKRLLQARGNGLGVAVSTGLLAEKTEGFSYAELIDLVRQLSLEEKVNGSLSMDLVNTILADLRPPLTETGGGMSPQLLGQMQALFANLSPNGSPAQRQPAADTTPLSPTIDTSPGSLAQKREELQNMPVRQLAIETFGGERAERLFEYAG